jgi:hypothetical protein
VRIKLPTLREAEKEAKHGHALADPLCVFIAKHQPKGPPKGPATIWRNDLRAVFEDMESDVLSAIKENIAYNWCVENGFNIEHGVGEGVRIVPKDWGRKGGLRAYEGVELLEAVQLAQADPNPGVMEDPKPEEDTDWDDYDPDDWGEDDEIDELDELLEDLEETKEALKTTVVDLPEHGIHRELEEDEFDDAFDRS